MWEGEDPGSLKRNNVRRRINLSATRDDKKYKHNTTKSENTLEHDEVGWIRRAMEFMQEWRRTVQNFCAFFFNQPQQYMCKEHSINVSKVTSASYIVNEVHILQRSRSCMNLR